VRELLEINHYTIQVVPVGYNKHSPPAHLLASRGPDEIRYIRIKKVSRRSRTVQNIEMMCNNEIVQYRKMLARAPQSKGVHCEIWIYTLNDGYRCFEVLPENVREIPKLAPDNFSLPQNGGAS
jgi:hypothetical protein